MSGWRVAHVGPEMDTCEIGGLRVWRFEWRHSARGSVTLASPDYPDEQRRFNIFEIGDETNRVTFAAAEVSNGIFAFYVEA
jgi:hypothetical protein